MIDSCVFWSRIGSKRLESASSMCNLLLSGRRNRMCPAGRFVLRHPMLRIESCVNVLLVLIALVWCCFASTAQALVPLTGATALSAGSKHNCVLIIGGGVKCWGFNGNGALGDSSTTDHRIATDVPGLSSGVTGITGGRIRITDRYFNHARLSIGGSVVRVVSFRLACVI